jgi:hypothetical protein
VQPVGEEGRWLGDSFVGGEVKMVATGRFACGVDGDVQIGEDAALGHFGEAWFNICDESYAQGAVLADLVFEHAESFVEGVDDEVDAALAEDGFYRGGVGVEGQGGATGDADGGGEAGCRAAYRAGEDELTAVAFAAADQLAVEAEGLELEVVGGEHVRIEWFAVSAGL